MQKLSAKLSRGAPQHLWKMGPDDTVSFASPNIRPCFHHEEIIKY